MAMLRMMMVVDGGGDDVNVDGGGDVDDDVGCGQTMGRRRRRRI